MAITVTRAHAPNSQGGLDDIQVTQSPMTFPAEEEVEVYFCELSSGARRIMWSTDENLSAAKTKTVMWKIGTNGVVLEDLRGSFLGSGDGQIKLDLSSLNWVQVSSELTAEGEDPTIVWNDSVSAQMWDWARLQDGDIADKAELTANNGWMFPVRPPDGLPHLQYVELSTMQEVVGGGGGGGGCSCDLSAEPPTEISSTWAQPVNTASWTKDNWQTQKDIYVPDFGDACTYFNLRNTYTCFAYYPTMNTVAQG